MKDLKRSIVTRGRLNLIKLPKLDLVQSHPRGWDVEDLPSLAAELVKLSWR